FHLKYNVTADTNFTFMQNTSANQFEYGLFADTTNFKNVQYTIGVYDATNYQYEGNINFRNITSCLNTLVTDSIMNNGNRIAYVQTAAAINGKTYELDINIIQDSAGYFYTLETTGNGIFDAWDFEYLPISQLPSSLASIPRMTYYKEPDIQQTICTSFQCSDNVIVVANYTERTGFTTFNGVFCPKPGPYDTLSNDCSSGPTRDGRIKPDIAATGNNIVAPGALWACKDQAINYPNDCNSSQDTMYMVFSGTSSASPAAAGVAVLYLQKNPTATNLQIKQAITGCTTKDNYTGNNLPNNNWGYGKLDGFGALTCNMLSTKIHQLKNEDVNVYPNPTTRMLNIECSMLNEDNVQYAIYDVLGNLIKNSTFQIKNLITLDVSGLQSGIYFLSLKTYKNSYTQKFVMQH
ncbi:MAG: S8/S53 family peptidase, partial [Bacteroidia bacterium]